MSNNRAPAQLVGGPSASQRNVNNSAEEFDNA